jgi:hypothetical protein
VEVRHGLSGNKINKDILQVTLLDHIRKKHILDKKKVTPRTEYVNNYRQKWLQHVKRMDRARIPKQMFRYAPTGRRLPGRPKRGWLETVTGR